MGRERRQPRYLEAKNCYVGQVVYWLMWCDPNAPKNEAGKYTAWYKYRPELVPEIWSRKIEKLTPRTIVLEELGKTKCCVYVCPQDAITAQYELFCFWQLRRDYGSYTPAVSLGEASAYLRKLAELEFNLNSEVRLDEMTEEYSTDDN